MSSGEDFNFSIIDKVYKEVVKQGLISDSFDRNQKVIEFVQPNELGQKLGGLEIGPEVVEDVDSLIKSVIRYSVKTCHPHFYNQLYHGSDAAGLAGQVHRKTCHVQLANNHRFFSVAQ